MAIKNEDPTDLTHSKYAGFNPIFASIGTMYKGGDSLLVIIRCMGGSRKKRKGGGG